MTTIGVTSLIILDYCKKSRSWTDIVKKIERSEPTTLTHINTLMQLGLLLKQDKKYYTTYRNIEAIKLAKKIIKLQSKLDMLLKRGLQNNDKVNIE